ncbi:Clp protease ClpC, partial [Patescibacteria group bacterium]|nr:Clp protease ClpC [Patescibacteria group bacterium]
MAAVICDICGYRPATARLTLVRNGRHQELDVCEIDLLRLQQQGSYISPLDALFAGEGFFGNFEPGREPTSDRYRETIDISQFLSQHAKQMVQKAAETAAAFGRTEIDTEHLLYSLMDSEVVQEILRQCRIKSEDICGYIDANAPKGDQEIGNQFTISPRIKRVL